ncbi:hypothetical protein D3C80_1149100 [compost metagenome]
MQMRVVGNDLFHFGISFIDIFRIARERDPAEWPDAAAEQRANIGGDETGEIEGVFNTHLFGHLADIVPIVEGRDAHFAKRQHRANVLSH